MRSRLLAVVALRARVPAGGVRARRVRSRQGVRATRMGFDPSRPAGSVDHQGSCLPHARDRPDDLPRNLPDAGAGARRRRAGSSADDRRADLRGRAGADRRAGLAVEGDPPLVPVRGLSLPLHLRRQPAGLHSAAADGRDVPRNPRLGHLRGDELDLRHACPGATDVRLHARRRDPLERARALLQELDPGSPEGRCWGSSCRSRSWVSSCG